MHSKSDAVAVVAWGGPEAQATDDAQHDETPEDKHKAGFAGPAALHGGKEHKLANEATHHVGGLETNVDDDDHAIRDATGRILGAGAFTGVAKQIALPHTDKPEPVGADGCTAKRRMIYIKTHKTGSSSLANIFHRYAFGHGCNIVLPKNALFLGWPNGNMVLGSCVMRHASCCLFLAPVSILLLFIPASLS
jgi:hypothetical protein